MVDMKLDILLQPCILFVTSSYTIFFSFWPSTYCQQPWKKWSNSLKFPYKSVICRFQTSHYSVQFHFCGHGQIVWGRWTMLSTLHTTLALPSPCRLDTSNHKYHSCRKPKNTRTMLKNKYRIFNTFYILNPSTESWWIRCAIEAKYFVKFNFIPVIHFICMMSNLPWYIFDINLT